MRRLLLCITTFLNIIIALADDQGYYYRTWNTDVIVYPDNTWRINEQYNVFFNEERHGIYRYIRNEYAVYRQEDPQSAEKYYAYRPLINIEDARGAEIDINESDENDCTVIRWGSEYFTITGEQSYSLEYTYQTPDDRITSRDYIYHSLLPDDVTTYIKAFNFNIRFNKPLPDDIADRLHIYTGQYGVQEAAQVTNLCITPTLISGTIYDVPSYNAVTLYAELPEGYYEDTVKTDPKQAWIFLGLTLLALVVVLYYEFTTHSPIITPVVEFSAPDGITPTLVGKIIDGSTDDIDIAAMIPWLAQHGYLNIREIPKESGLFSKKADVELTKVKDLPDDSPAYQRAIMDLLFSKGDTLLMSKMGDRHELAAKAKKEVNDLFVGSQKLVTSHHSLWMILLIAFSALTLACSSRVSSYYSENIGSAIVWCLSFVFAWLMRSASFVRSLFTSPMNKFLNQLLRIVVFLIICSFIYFMAFHQGDLHIPNVWLYTVGLGCFIACELSDRLVTNTPYRAKIAGHLVGFRKFIETAEKDRLQMLVDQNPEYFYDVLPYAMIFGLTDKWTNLFSDIEIKPVSWYSSSSMLNASNFASSINSFSTSVSKSIATSSVAPSSGGGGYSGGGGGGGGAGSW